MDDILELINNIYMRLSSIARYNTRTRVISESVAEHSYLVALICLVLADLNDWDDEDILKSAILHDVEEILSGDIPGHVKVRKKLNKELEALNTESMSTLLSVLPENLQHKYFDLWKRPRVSLGVVGFADSVAGILYCIREAKLGNRYMHDILGNYLIKLDEYREFDWAKSIIEQLNEEAFSLGVTKEWKT